MKALHSHLLIYHNFNCFSPSCFSGMQDQLLDQLLDALGLTVHQELFSQTLSLLVLSYNYTSRIHIDLQSLYHIDIAATYTCCKYFWRHITDFVALQHQQPFLGKRASHIFSDPFCKPRSPCSLPTHLAEAHLFLHNSQPLQPER